MWKCDRCGREHAEDVYVCPCSQDGGEWPDLVILLLIIAALLAIIGLAFS